MEEKALSILNDVTERVRYYARRSAGDMLELGKALTEAKALVPHGEWTGYLKENAGMEARTAQNFMQAYRKWGTEGERVAGLSIGQMIALLPATDAEMEKLTAENDVGSMSSREIKKAIQEAREEEQRKARESMDIMAQDKLRELARQKDAFDKTLKEQVSAAKAEQAEQIEALKERLNESQTAADELRSAMEDAEARARDATQAAIESARDVSAQSSKLENEARKLRQELADKDAMIEELQGQYDAMREDYLDAKSAIAKGDAERSTADILSAEAVSDSVRMFIGQVGRVPYMHGAFAAMNDMEREEYRACVEQVMEWAEKSLKAIETVRGIGGVIE